MTVVAEAILFGSTGAMEIVPASIHIIYRGGVRTLEVVSLKSKIFGAARRLLGRGRKGKRGTYSEGKVFSVELIDRVVGECRTVRGEQVVPLYRLTRRGDDASVATRTHVATLVIGDGEFRIAGRGWREPRR